MAKTLAAFGAGDHRAMLSLCMGWVWQGWASLLTMSRWNREGTEEARRDRTLPALQKPPTVFFLPAPFVHCVQHWKMNERKCLTQLEVVKALGFMYVVRGQGTVKKTSIYYVTLFPSK